MWCGCGGLEGGVRRGKKGRVWVSLVCLEGGREARGGRAGFVKWMEGTRGLCGVIKGRGTMGLYSGIKRLLGGTMGLLREGGVGGGSGWR